MPSRLYNLFNRKNTPQDQPIRGSGQVPNSAGGYAWQLDPWQRFARFLVLGTEGGTYYIAESTLTRENAQNALTCLSLDGQRFVDTVVEISSNGRAYKNDPALFALALAAASEQADVRAYALKALPQVARTGTHLFHFASYVDGLRGWGRGLRQAVAEWYQDRSDEQLAFQLAKYQSRDGWSHRDLLRLAHPMPANEGQAALFRWAAGKESVPMEQLVGMVQAFERLKAAADEAEVAALVREYRAPREVIPTQYLTSPLVWEALLPTLGLTALLRNLGNLSKVGLVRKGSAAAKEAAGRICDRQALRRARVHPLQALAALVTYSQGHGARGKGEWDTAPEMVDALNSCFELCFDNIEPAGKRLYLALDVSGSMTCGQVSGIPGLTPRVASAALALMTLRTEKQAVIRGFSHAMTPLQIDRNMSIETVVRVMDHLPFGGTDCALPMLDAIKNQMEVDTFIIYTDSETWFGKIHPAQALVQYRQKTGIPAKLVVVGMLGNRFSIADPADAGMLDVVGFSTDTPAVIADFAADRLGASAQASANSDEQD